MVPTLLLKVRAMPAAGFGLAALLLILAVLLRMATPVTLTYATFYPAIIIATVAGGRVIGVMTALVATICAIYFFVPPSGSFAVSTSDVWNAGAFWVVSVIIVATAALLADLLIAAHDRAEKLTQLNDRLSSSEKQLQTVMLELSHRMKNQYSVILAMSRMTGETSDSIGEFESSFSRRLYSMSRAHDLLTRAGWKPVSLMALIRTELEPFAIAGRIATEDADVKLREHAVSNIGMALHELATNAAKHGAWSGPAGGVTISWKEQDGHFRLVWQESGGPPSEGLAGHGFGRTLIEKIVPAALEGRAGLSLDPPGLRWSLDLPASCLQEDTPGPSRPGIEMETISRSAASPGTRPSDRNPQASPS